MPLAHHGCKAPNSNSLLILNKPVSTGEISGRLLISGHEWIHPLAHRVTQPSSTASEVSALGTLLDAVLCASSSWLLIWIPWITFYNELVNLSNCCLLLWVALANQSNPRKWGRRGRGGGGSQEPFLCSQLIRSTPGFGVRSGAVSLFNWSTVDLQCVSFCRTTKWFGYRYKFFPIMVCYWTLNRALSFIHSTYNSLPLPVISRAVL